MIPPHVPQQFRTDENGALKRDLARMSLALIEWAKDIPDPSSSVPTVAELAGTLLAFGQMMRVSPADGETVQLVLPPLDTSKGGQAIRVARMNGLGLVLVNAQGAARIDGVARVLLYNSVRVTTIWYDGAEDYISDGTALDVGEGL